MRSNSHTRRGNKWEILLFKAACAEEAVSQRQLELAAAVRCVLKFSRTWNLELGHSMADHRRTTARRDVGLLRASSRVRDRTTTRLNI